jgi:hypothetical protein
MDLHRIGAARRLTSPIAGRPWVAGILLAALSLVLAACNGSGGGSGY